MKFILVLFLFSLPVFASEGVTIRGGGDEIALDFGQTFRRALAEIRANHVELNEKISHLRIDNLPSEVKVYVVDEPLLVNAGASEQDSVAVNEVSTLSIWLHRARWLEITSDRIREAIALHEFLSLAGAERTGFYPISSAYLAKYQKQNGASVIISGREAVDPSLWNKRKISCEYKVETIDAKTKKKNVETLSTVAAQVGWRVAGREYDMTFFLSTSGGGYKGPGFMNFNDKKILKQSSKSFEWENESGRLFQTNECEIEVDLLVFGTMGSGNCDDAPTVLFEERVDDRRTKNWTWDRGQKRYALSQKTFTRQKDGTVRTVEEELALEESSTYEQISGVTTCEERSMPDDSWISLAESQRIAPQIAELNKLARKADQAEIAFRACNPGNCPQKEHAARSALDKFDRVWRKIYQDARDRSSEDPANETVLARKDRLEQK